MQDRFKFRVWCKTNQEWEKDEICITNKEHYIITNPKFTRVTNIDPQYHEINFCSGLKDKNGKLIYEGDILDLYVSTKKLYRYQVKFEIGSFMLVSQDEIFDFKNVWNDYVYPLSQLYYEYQNEENWIEQCEVVGNIYENPELLKDGE